MKSISLYSARFRVIEYVSYFLLVVPWLGGLLGENFLSGTPAGLVLKLTLSAAILAFIFLLRDVRRKIHSLDTLKQNLSLAAIHDLKGPLTAIIGALSIIEETDMEPGLRDNLLRAASQSSRDMVGLIQILLDTEKMEIAEMVVQKRPLEACALINEATARFMPVSVKTGIKLVISAGEGLPSLYADRDLLLRVMENLLLNAFRYSRRGGEIRIKAGSSGGKFRFEVADTGSGIAPGHIKRVFEKYYRVDGNDENSRQGSGFGLYFCRLAVEAHKGLIAIDSVPGRGTTVSFEIPGGA
ncbi:MAG: two-component system OmpR family sensor kinase [Elusimicrobia bacterium]|nr:MAG: two-component system OmpR family sensor kinase [Elusimicrobiota bacterium]KAF0154700.1 MAG: two-component system OmpR family sensor kinase [Elusimicrobiota bacterium]